jgi:nucleoside-diphosphate-sugar epimerase
LGSTYRPYNLHMQKEERQAGRSSSLRTAVVSGANGYLGAHLVRSLIDGGTEVHALVNRDFQQLGSLLPRNQIHLLADDVSQVVSIVDKIQPDAIFHLAAVYKEPTSAESIESMFRGNILLGASLAFAATRCVVPPVFLNAGTYWQFAEDGSYLPNTLYATTKQGFQDLLAYYQRRHQLSATTLVLYDVFGPSDRRPKLWNKLIQAAPGTHIPLSTGTQEIELIHVTDVTDAFLLAAEGLKQGHLTGSLYSVCTQRRVSLRQLVEEFNAASGLGLDLGWGELPAWEGVVRVPWRGQTLPGWRPRYDPIPSLVELIGQPTL